METLHIAGALGALLALASVLGLIWRARQGRVSRRSGGKAPPAVPLALVDSSSALTLVQFSGAFCSYCAAMRRVLSAAAESSAGVVAYREVDIADHAMLIESLRITQTPTTLIVTNAGHVVSRISGAAKPPVVDAEIANAIEVRKAASDEYLI